MLIKKTMTLPRSSLRVPTLLLVCLLHLVPGQAQTVQLITEKEAQLPPAKDLLKTRGVARGPKVTLISPDVAASAVHSPFSLHVLFEGRGGSKIDPASVRLIYLKAIKVDLTPRIKGVISEAGIDLAQAKVPPGEHPLRIRVKDEDGRETSAVFQLVVHP